jgi:serine/threonine protein phosphatase PrpC
MVRAPAVPHTGVHPVNEDSNVRQESLRLHVVADGIAGRAAGEVKALDVHDEDEE